MDPNKTKRNELLMEKIANGLESRGMRAYRASSRDEALSLALGMIPEGSSVGIGGCMSAREIGLYEVLENGPYTFEDHGPTQGIDWFISSANAITEDGIIVNIDGNGNRVAASVGGPKKVMYVIGRNKIVEGGIDDAIARIKRCACPPNCRRLGKQTPCALTGKCADCDSPDRICKVTVVFDRRPTGIAAEVVLVDEDLGF